MTEFLKKKGKKIEGMAVNADIEGICKTIAEEFDLPLTAVKLVYTAQAKLTRDTIRNSEQNNEDTFYEIRWRNIGSFIPNKLKHIIKENNKKQENKNNGKES